MTKIRRQKFKKETSHKLLKVANDDFYSASILSTAPKFRPETVLYHVQQSIEKAIKSVLIYKELSVLLTRDLDVLIAELPDDVSKNLPSGVGELTQYATIRRYLDGEELIEADDIRESLSVAEVFLNWASGIVNQT